MDPFRSFCTSCLYHLCGAARPELFEEHTALDLQAHHGNDVLGAVQGQRHADPVYCDAPGDLYASPKNMTISARISLQQL